MCNRGRECLSPFLPSKEEGSLLEPNFDRQRFLLTSMGRGERGRFLLTFFIHSYVHTVRRLPYMTCAQRREGGGVTQKRRRSKEGCVNCLLRISTNCRQGGRGFKIPIFFWDVIYGRFLMGPSEDGKRTEATLTQRSKPQ